MQATPSLGKEANYDVVGSYDQDAINGFTDGFLEGLLGQVVPEGGQKILDAMAGDGNLTARLYAYCQRQGLEMPEMVTLEYSRQQYELACARLSGTPARVMWGDVLTMSDRGTGETLADETFDRVVIKSGNHEIPQGDQGELYQNIWRVLKPGGYLINLGFLFDDAEEREEFGEITRLKDELVGMSEAVMRRHFLTREELYAHLEEVGFVEIGCRKQFHYRIDSRVAIENYVSEGRVEQVHRVVQGCQAKAMHLRRRGLIRFESDRSQMMAPGEVTVARKPSQAMITDETFTRYPYDLLCALSCYRELQQSIVAHIAEGSHILDVACGPGHLVHFLAGLQGSYRGLDTSAAFIRTARERYGWQVDVAFEVGDMNAMSEVSPPYDVMVVANALYLPDAVPEAVLREGFEALSEGGRLIVSGPASAESFRAALPQMRSQLAREGRLGAYEAQLEAIAETNDRLLSAQGHYWSAQEMAELLLGLGFRRIVTADPSLYYHTGYLVVAEK